jgi:hypothetical protein
LIHCFLNLADRGKIASWSLANWGKFCDNDLSATAECEGKSMHIASLRLPTNPTGKYVGFEDAWHRFRDNAPRAMNGRSPGVLDHIELEHDEGVAVPTAYDYKGAVVATGYEIFEHIKRHNYFRPVEGLPAVPVLAAATA